MKFTPPRREEISSATLTQTLGLIVALSGMVVATSYAADPGWWNARGAVHALVVTTNGGVVTTNYAPNDHLAVNEGQLKQFTSKAVAEMNADLPDGAGANLNNLVTGWSNNYATNGYNATTHPPVDFAALNVGQLKTIASLIYGQLATEGYTGLTPTWLAPNASTDHTVANLGQLKSVFNFDFSLAPLTNVTATANTGGTITLSWTLPSANTATSYLVEQQNIDGTWSVIATLSNPATTSYAVTGLAAGENPAFQIIAQNGRKVSLAASTPPDSGLLPPSDVTATPGPTLGEIDVSWVNHATDATYILIHQSTDGINWTKIAVLTNTALTTYAVTNLTVGQNYYFGVAAGNN